MILAMTKMVIIIITTTITTNNNNNKNNVSSTVLIVLISGWEYQGIMAHNLVWYQHLINQMNFFRFFA